MSGALTTPLDLTDFGTSARVQAGFKLTRLAARFDIINKAGISRFSIETVSMGNGRRGATFFPIRIYGTIPDAEPEEIISCPARSFTGENANNGIQTGTFYSYPSPKDDNGFLILSGKYKINETEMKQVSYRIPFTQRTADGGSTALEINNNHRYTVEITKADEYHLDVNIAVADWADDGNIDDYNPEGQSGDIRIDIPDDYKDDTEYNEDTKTVSMSLKTGSNFQTTVAANAALTIFKSYAGGLEAQQYDWLEISEP